MLGTGAGGGVNINISGVTIAGEMDIDYFAQELGNKLRDRLARKGTR
jgi:hypothetical protein